jgi:N utilization substance protein A
VRDEIQSAIYELEKERGISRDYIVTAIKEAFEQAYQQQFQKDNFMVKADTGTGLVRLYSRKMVVAKVTDSDSEIILKDARKVEPAAKVGDEVLVQVKIEQLPLAVVVKARKFIDDKIRERENDLVYERFHSQVGTLVNGEVLRQNKEGLLINLARCEGILTRDQQIPGERLRFQGVAKALILSVDKSPQGPRVLLSRAHPDFIQRLVELEVPEVGSGLVEVKRIVREPGSRAKVAVFSRDPKIDPVGAVIGPMGARIRAVSREIAFEHIDVVRFDQNPVKYVVNAFSPAKVVDAERRADGSFVVRATAEAFPVALGKSGVNVRLVERLVDASVELVQVDEGGQQQAALTHEAGETHEESTNL